MNKDDVLYHTMHGPPDSFLPIFLAPLYTSCLAYSYPTTTIFRVTILPVPYLPNCHIAGPKLLAFFPGESLRPRCHVLAISIE